MCMYQRFLAPALPPDLLLMGEIDGQDAEQLGFTFI